ncbi:unnamed protein product [Victoria cruziana]
MPYNHEEEAIVALLAELTFVFVFFWYRQLQIPRILDHPYRDVGSLFIQNMIFGHPRICLDLLRMSKDTFLRLCDTLKSKKLLVDACDITIEEQVAMFLLTIGHNEHNHVVESVFQHFGQATRKYIDLVLRGICQLGRDYIQRPNNDIPTRIRSSDKYYPYFQDCLGAIGGTHIPAWVPVEEQVRYHNKKGVPSQNVFAVVGFDMRFHYVLAGWEGSASNSRVLYSALNHPNDPFVIPEGKYYLADCCYPNIVGLLTSYRGYRHLSEFNIPGSRTPQTAEELFNYRHSSLRIIVERTFKVLRRRFPLLKAQVEYPFRKQVQFVLAACALHNFIMEQNPDAEQFEDDSHDNDSVPTAIISEAEVEVQVTQHGSNNGLRTAITTQMFKDDQKRHQQ